MLQLIEKFLTSIFYNYPQDIVGGSEKEPEQPILEIKKNDQEKEPITLKIIKEPEQPILEIKKNDQEKEPIILKIIKKEPEKKNKLREGYIGREAEGEIVEDITIFDKIEARKRKTLKELLPEALDRRLDRLVEKMNSDPDDDSISLEVKYINYLKRQRNSE